MKLRSEKTKHVFNLLSLYTGAGGLDHGFESTGQFVTRACVEMEPIFAQTLRINQVRGFVPYANIYEASVSDLDPQAIKKETCANQRIDGLIGGPPCQGFSIRGKRLGLGDHRSDETFTFMKWVSILKPKFFLMENVPRMIDIDSGRVLDQIKTVGLESGYSVYYHILNAADYGSATKRKRIFIIGFHGNIPFSFPEPTHLESETTGYAKHIGSATALVGLPDVGYQKPGFPQGHIAVRHTPVVIERFKKLKPGQQDNVRQRTRLDAERPSPTLVAGNLHDIRSHIHPTEPRELTNRESARLHGFPDKFEFAGNHGAMGVQIANSVPIPLAAALARQIANTLRGAP